MRVMADTNIVFSALLFPDSTPARALLCAAHNHTLILCDHIVSELFDAVSRKRPDLSPDVDVFLAEFPHETAIAPREPSKLIADPRDAPIPNAAILEDVDVIISGDKHFLNLDMERPKVMTAAGYLELIEAEV
jgi:predicted nucleic acid-binding protein